MAIPAKDFEFLHDRNPMFRQRTVAFPYKTCLEENGENETLEIALKLVNAGSSIQRRQAGADKASLL